MRATVLAFEVAVPVNLRTWEKDGRKEAGGACQLCEVDQLSRAWTRASRVGKEWGVVGGVEVVGALCREG